MKIWFLSALVGPWLFLSASLVLAGVPSQGDRYKLLLKRHSEYQENDSGSGSSDDNDVIEVRTISVGHGALDFEYDLPADATAGDREVGWQFPAKVHLGADGTMTLLNTAELETRRDRFLKSAGLTTQMCGRWIFTWNAFKIECDPQSALSIISRFQTQPAVLADGAPFGIKGAVGSTPMKCARSTAQGQRCTVVLPLDEGDIRRDLVESDVVIGDITGKPISAFDAAKSRAATQIKGTIEVTFEADLDGTVWKRTTVVRSEQRDPGGRTRSSVATTVLTRTKIGA